MGKQAGQTIGQRPCAEKSGKLATLPDLPDSLHLAGAVVTIDPMGTHPEIAAALHNHGADYVLALKLNQPKAYAEVARHFNAVSQIDPLTPSARYGCFSRACQKASGWNPAVLP